jgi:hypothetical protein
VRRHFRLNLLLFALLLTLVAAPHAGLASPGRPPAPPPGLPPTEDRRDEGAALDARPLGLNTHLASRYPDAATMAVPAAAAAESGAGWAREDIHWYRIQPTPGTWDWSYTDAAFRELLARNLQIVGVLGHPPGWATPEPDDLPGENSFFAPDPQRFAAFAQEVVRRYGAYVHHWEIWNEPDNALFWRPAPDPRAYAALLAQTAAAIRGVDPRATIILGGINPFDTEFLRQIAEAGAWANFDVLAIHPYVDPATPEAGRLDAAADGVRALLARYGERPIWATELGWSSGASDRSETRVSEQEQADYLVRATLLLLRSGVERVFWYALKDDPGNAYGLVPYGAGRLDYSGRKPAFLAFRTLGQVLGGARLEGMRDLFTRTVALDFAQPGVWYRGADQARGSFTPAEGRGGRPAMTLRYTFASVGNEYVAFTRAEAAPIAGRPAALGLWVNGDGSGNTLKLRLRDAEGELLQFTLGAVGAPGWAFLQAPITGVVPAWDRLSPGNGRVDYPVRLESIVLDDAPDSFIGSGALDVEDLTAINGPEAYDIQLRRGDGAADVLWAPGGVRARLPLAGARARIIGRDGEAQVLPLSDGGLTLDLGPSPVYVRAAP